MKKFFAILLVAIFAVCNLTAANNWYAKQFPPSLVNSSGKRINTAAALKGKMVLVYFSASWCGPCRAFTPQLVDFYKKAAKKNNIELVFVSCDRDSAAMMDYMKKYSMPWLAIPFESGKRGALQQAMQVRGIPTLVVFDANGKVITKDARRDVVSLGPKAIADWKFTDYNKNRNTTTSSKNRSKNKNKRSK